MGAKGYKAILSDVAIALTLLAFYPYIRDILKGVVKPHVFSWIIWSSTTLIVFLTQLQAGGGLGLRRVWLHYARHRTFGLYQAGRCRHHPG